MASLGCFLAVLNFVGVLSRLRRGARCPATFKNPWVTFSPMKAEDSPTSKLQTLCFFFCWCWCWCWYCMPLLFFSLAGAGGTLHCLGSTNLQLPVQTSILYAKEANTPGTTKISLLTPHNSPKQRCEKMEKLKNSLGCWVCFAALDKKIWKLLANKNPQN